MLIAEIFGEWQLPFLMEANRLSTPTAFIMAVLFPPYFALLMFCYGICKFSLNDTNVFLNVLSEDSGFRLRKV